MARPRRFPQEIDPGPVQIHARKVSFDVADAPLHWIPGHPVASNVIGLLNIVLPAAERWFVATYTEALPLVKDPKLAEDMRVSESVTRQLESLVDTRNHLALA